MSSVLVASVGKVWTPFNHGSDPDADPYVDDDELDDFLMAIEHVLLIRTSENNDFYHIYQVVRGVWAIAPEKIRQQMVYRVQPEDSDYMIVDFPKIAEIMEQNGLEVHAAPHAVPHRAITSSPLFAPRPGQAVAVSGQIREWSLF
jgi:hypothetical protein